MAASWLPASAYAVCVEADLRQYGHLFTRKKKDARANDAEMVDARGESVETQYPFVPPRLFYINGLQNADNLPPEQSAESLER